MTYDFYIGIDPGENGGIVVLSVRTGNVETMTRMPEDHKSILCYLTPYTRYGRNPAPAKIAGCLESVHSMPGQGVASSFKFGKQAGAMEMALNVVCTDPPILVSPQKWQKALGIRPKGKAEKKAEFKQRLRATAQKMFPRLGGITLQTCDALLIAVYCKRLHEGTL